MSVIVHSKPEEIRFGFAYLEAVARGAARRMSRRMRVWRDRRALHELPDYLLHDIGISRSEIDYAVENGRRPEFRYPY